MRCARLVSVFCAEGPAGAPLSCQRIRWFPVGIRRVENNRAVTRRGSGKKPKKKPEDPRSGPAAGVHLYRHPDSHPSGSRRNDRPTPAFSGVWGQGRSYPHPQAHSHRHLPGLRAPSLPRPHLWYCAISPNSPDIRVEPAAERWLQVQRP